MRTTEKLQQLFFDRITRSRVANVMLGDIPRNLSTAVLPAIFIYEDSQAFSLSNNFASTFHHSFAESITIKVVVDQREQWKQQGLVSDDQYSALRDLVYRLKDNPEETRTVIEENCIMGILLDDVTVGGTTLISNDFAIDYQDNAEINEDTFVNIATIQFTATTSLRTRST